VPLELPDSVSMFVSSVFGVGIGSWVYLCPKFFANWFWIKRYFPSASQNDRIAPAKFVSFFRILGLLNIWVFAVSWIMYWVVRIAGLGVVGPAQPPAI
jgi:hypothetical protein